LIFGFRVFARHAVLVGGRLIGGFGADAALAISSILAVQTGLELALGVMQPLLMQIDLTARKVIWKIGARTGPTCLSCTAFPATV
jgi:hypothetical protein